MSDHDSLNDPIPDSETVFDGEDAPDADNIAAHEDKVREAFHAPRHGGASHDLGLTAAKAASRDFSHLDPQGVVPKNLLNEALKFLEAHSTEFKNQSHISVLDYSQNSNKRRLHVIDLKSGQVQSLFVANGKKSEPVHNGFATRFGNEVGSNMSSLGFVRTAETYDGKHGLSLRLDGLSGPSNSNMRKRAVVVHGADYVKNEARVQGRSNGCPAVPMSQVKDLIGKIKEGSLMFFGRSER